MPGKHEAESGVPPHLAVCCALVIPMPRMQSLASQSNLLAELTVSGRPVSKNKVDGTRGMTQVQEHTHAVERSFVHRGDVSLPRHLLTGLINFILE